SFPCVPSVCTRDARRSCDRTDRRAPGYWPSVRTGDSGCLLLIEKHGVEHRGAVDQHSSQVGATQPALQAATGDAREFLEVPAVLPCEGQQILEPGPATDAPVDAQPGATRFHHAQI